MKTYAGSGSLRKIIDNKTKSWMVVKLHDGQLQMEWMSPRAFRSASNFNSISLSSVSINDGRWHHVTISR